jgi:hypothetical protein
MDKDVLHHRLEQLCRKAMSEARAAVDSAPDGQWISASEWQVRDIMQRLTQESYQAMLQAKADGHAAAAEAAFSPGGGDGSAEPRPTFLPGAHRRRRD